MATSIYNGNGRALQLGRELGRGGEAYVREVAGLPGIVAKIYHSLQSPEKLEKLAVLPSFATPERLSVAAWPTATISERPGGPPCGVLLPRVGGREIHVVFSPAQRRRDFPRSDWSFLVHVAMNAAAAVQTIHETGVVIGDLNQRGLFVSNEGVVRLIDCDSFQLKWNNKVYRCEVRVPDYTPPELQSVNLRTTDALTQHDSFALGVLVFQLLFMGRHPFAGRFLAAGDMPISRAISERRFAFSRDRASFQMDLPLCTPSLHLVPQRLVDMFEETFRGDPLRRPSAADWYGELKSLKDALRRCSAEPSHMVSPHLRDCPWCELEHAGVPPFFSLVVVPFDFDAGFDLAGMSRELGQMPEIADRDELLDAISPPPPRPVEIAPVLAYRRLGPIETVPRVPELVLLQYPEIPEFRPPPDVPDLNSAYAPEVEPSLPEFVPETVPPNPQLELVPTPSFQRIPVVDHVSAPRERWKRKRRSPEYRIAKFLAFGLVAGALFMHATGSSELPVILTTGAGLLFAATSCLMWLVFFRDYLVLMKAARKAQRSADADRAKLIQWQELERLRVERANAARTEEHASKCAELDRQRAQLPQINEEKRKLWAAQCETIRQKQKQIRERNRTKAEAWTEARRLNEAILRRQWETDVENVRRKRDQVEDQNRARRHEWEESLKRHNAMVHAIEETNRRRAEMRERFDREFERRESALSQAERRLETLLADYESRSSRLRKSLAETRDHFMASVRKYRELKVSFERERDRLLSNVRQLQLDDFLRRQLIGDASITGVGQKRKDVLIYFGIETAYDITRQGLEAVVGRGFGPKLRQALIDWRAECEGRFVFNSKASVTSPAMRSLQNKYQPERNSLQQSLRGILARWRETVVAVGQHRQESIQLAEPAYGALLQAKADLYVAQQYRS